MNKKFNIKNLFKKKEISIETNTEEEDLYNSIENKIKNRVIRRDVKIVAKGFQDKICKVREQENEYFISNSKESDIFELALENIKQFSYRDTWNISKNKVEKLNNVKILSLFQGHSAYAINKSTEEFDDFSEAIDEEKVILYFKREKDLRILERYLTCGYDKVVLEYLKVLNASLFNNESFFKCNCKNCMFCFIYKEEKDKIDVALTSDEIIDKKLALLLLKPKKEEIFKFQKNILVGLEPIKVKNYVIRNDIYSSIIYSYLLEEEEIRKRIKDEEITDTLKNIDYIISQVRYENNYLRLEAYNNCFLKYKDFFKNIRFENLSIFIQKIQDLPKEPHNVYENIL